jgi:hypothetical protein
MIAPALPLCLRAFPGKPSTLDPGDIDAAFGGCDMGRRRSVHERLPVAITVTP